MIDAPSAMIIVGSAVQAAPAARRVVAPLARRAVELVAALPFTPTPEPHRDLEQLLASID